MTSPSLFSLKKDTRWELQDFYLFICNSNYLGQYIEDKFIFDLSSKQNSTSLEKYSY